MQGGQAARCKWEGATVPCRIEGSNYQSGINGRNEGENEYLGLQAGPETKATNELKARVKYHEETTMLHITSTSLQGAV